MSPVRADSMTALSSNSARNLVRLVDVSREKEQPRPPGRDRLPESRRFLSAAFNAVGNRPAVHLSDGALAIHETADQNKKSKEKPRLWGAGAHLGQSRWWNAEIISEKLSVATGPSEDIRSVAFLQ